MAGSRNCSQTNSVNFVQEGKRGSEVPHRMACRRRLLLLLRLRLGSTCIHSGGGPTSLGQVLRVERKQTLP